MGTEVADGLFSMVNASPAGGRDTMDQEVHHSQTMMNRRFNIIYIPDAAMRIVSKEKAKNDLGYILHHCPSQNTSLYSISQAAFTLYLKAELNIQML